MEATLKKFQQKFRKVSDEMERWGQLQSRLVSQFRNISSIVERLEVIKNPKNYGTLINVKGLKESVFEKQMESIQSIFQSMNKTLEEFRGVVLTIEKMYRDGIQLVNQVSEKQLQQRVGIKPSLAYCLDGLQRLDNMHNSEYRLKLSLISEALPKLVWKPNPSDLSALQQLLVDQPNILEEEVQEIFDIVLAGENYSLPGSNLQTTLGNQVR